MRHLVKSQSASHLAAGSRLPGDASLRYSSSFSKAISLRIREQDNIRISTESVTESDRP